MQYQNDSPSNCLSDNGTSDLKYELTLSSGLKEMNTKPKPKDLDNNMNFILTQFYFYSTVYTYSKFTKLNSVKSTFFET